MADTVVSFFEDVSPLLTALRLDPFAARLSGYMIGGGKGRGCMVSQRYNVYIQLEAWLSTLILHVWNRRDITTITITITTTTSLNAIALTSSKTITQVNSHSQTR